ncbi:unnamed protein product [Hymenolepis diminuta]|nr:unnamed protein product [Hymenolepis diminuta]VUZ47808.1 unnamed protein product [Hymenolepis diminuta]VUZ57084.1 unnamed protein product [Hymenolepis diminuta]
MLFVNQKLKLFAIVTMCALRVHSRDLCRDYSAADCKTEMDGEICLLKVTFRRPAGEDKFFAFYSILDSFFSYVINWGSLNI